MATTLKQREYAPDDLPDTPTGLSTAAAALAPEMIWSRLERWIAWRWSPRTVAWLVEGPGEWEPPLSPATIATTKIWNAGTFAWETVTLSPSPGDGFVLDGAGPYQIVATVGGGSPAPEVPEDVNEAFRRLAEYMAAGQGKVPGSTSHSVDIGPVKIQAERSATWLARAIHNSGAADLLLRYRRAA